MNENRSRKSDYMNPYVVGILVGLTLLASFMLLGAGIGASGGTGRLSAFVESLVACRHTFASEYFGQWGKTPLKYYLVFMLAGTFLGGLFSALIANRITFGIEKGNACPARQRLILAFVGGTVVGFASRLAQGCTSGQALTGGALMLTGSIVFMLCLFVGGYAAAHFVGRQWHD